MAMAPGLWPVVIGGLDQVLGQRPVTVSSTAVRCSARSRATTNCANPAFSAPTAPPGNSFALTQHHYLGAAPGSRRPPEPEAPPSGSPVRWAGLSDDHQGAMRVRPP